MRRSHTLKPNKGCEQPQDAIWVDTETKPIILPDGTQRHELMFGFAAHARTVRPNEWIAPQWIKFTTIDMFWAWVFSRLHGKSKMYIFAHNWAFDAPVLNTFNVLPDNDWELTGSVIQSPPIILKWRKAPHTIQMVDTLNIWRMSLAKLGESIGLPKLTMPNYDDDQDQWDTYGKRDVEIIMLACQKWWKFLTDNDLGGFASTTAAQSIRTFRHKFMSHEILIDDNENALALARNALHGGRTECHFIGQCKDTIYKLDINSQYPAVMRTQYMPRKLIGHYRVISIDELTSWLNKYCIIAECHIKTNEPVFPVKHDKRLVFPTGEYIATLSTPELQYALKHNLITKITQCCLYERDILFADYINYFYNYRLQCKASGDEVDALNAKLLMNSLYGKFAQKGLIYKKSHDVDDTDIKVWTEFDVETGQTFNHRQYAKIVETLESETESRDSHPAIAAHITAHARNQLWGLMCGAGHGNYVYCDTDSLWVNAEGYLNLTEHIDPNGLGMLKIEGIHDNIEIYGPKDYRVDGVACIKGIRKNAVELDAGVYEQDRFTTLIGLLRQGDLSAPLVSKVTKHLRRIYSKGKVMDDGRITPLTLSLDD